MSPQKNKECNKNWEAEIEAYDAACKAEEIEFRKRHITFSGSGNADLTEEETAVFEMVLRGVPVSEIAEQAGVEVGEIAGLIEIIRAKLSLSD